MSTGPVPDGSSKAQYWCSMSGVPRRAPRAPPDALRASGRDRPPKLDPRLAACPSSETRRRARRTILRTTTRTSARTRTARRARTRRDETRTRKLSRPNAGRMPVQRQSTTSAGPVREQYSTNAAICRTSTVPVQPSKMTVWKVQLEHSYSTGTAPVQHPYGVSTVPVTCQCP